MPKFSVTEIYVDHLDAIVITFGHLNTNEKVNICIDYPSSPHALAVELTDVLNSLLKSFYLAKKEKKDAIQIEISRA
ncbi:MAG TPA: hypothetical protein VK622_10690 [Puia sp.]|nr:hypothetical protein [Puia sp.]